MVKKRFLFVLFSIVFCLSISGQTTDIYKVNTTKLTEKVDTIGKNHNDGTDNYNINTNGVNENTDTLKKNNIESSNSYEVKSSVAKEQIIITKKNRRNMFIDPIPPYYNYGKRKLKRMQERYQRKLEKTFNTTSKK